MTRLRRKTTAIRLLLLALLTGFQSLALADDWPDFRGPLGNGHARDTRLPLAWSETANVAWKVELPGRGWSSPVVLGDKIWLTTAYDDERSLRVLAVDKATGRLLHNVEIFHPDAWQASHLENSYASPSPVGEDERLYVHFGTYGTAALSTVDASVLWRNQELQIDHETGPGSSPILFGDLLIVHYDGTDQRFVAAFDTASGAVRWRAPRSFELDKKGPHKKAFSTPLIVHFAGQAQLISPAAGQVGAYDPATGSELWRVRYEGYSNVPRPVAGLGMVFVDTGYMKPHMLAIRLGGHGDVTDSHVVWSYHWQVPANPSPILIGSRLYMVSDWGIASWLDVHKSEKQDLWRQRLEGRYYASPIYAQGRIYNFSLEGRSVVVAAQDAYQELAVNQIDGRIHASPAVSDGAFFIRTETHLYRIEEQHAPP